LFSFSFGTSVRPLPPSPNRFPEPRPLHGLGLFATRDIQTAELISLYPGDALLLWADAHDSSDQNLQVRLGPHCGDQTASGCFMAKSATQPRDYEMRYSETRSVVGDPALRGDPAYLAHFCNDGATLFASGGSVSDAERELYSRASAAAANAAQVIIEGCHHGAVALRPIAAGEEVLVSYGEGYWLSRAGSGVLEDVVARDQARGEKGGTKATLVPTESKTTTGPNRKARRLASKSKKAGQPGGPRGGGGFGSS